MTADLIGATEAAAILGKDKSTITRRAKAGKLTPALIGPAGVYLFNRADIEQLADEPGISA